MPETSEQRQDAALVALLSALPATRLERVLKGLGVAPEKVEAVTHKPDDRKCLTCGYGFVRCRQIDAKLPDSRADERHEWKPDRNRAGIRTDAT